MKHTQKFYGKYALRLYLEEDKPTRNKVLGGMLLIVSIVTMVVYFIWLFLSPDIVVWGRTLREWALIVPVALIVYAFLFVVAWIGWALASTPPSFPPNEAI